MVNKKRILVKAYTHKNLGDDLFLKMLFERYPEIHFCLLSQNSSYNNIFPNHNVKTIARRKSLFENKFIKKIFVKLNRPLWIKLITGYTEKFLNRTKNENDILVVIGGSIFMEGKNEIIPQLNTLDLLQRIFSNKPTFILGTNFGPYKSIEFREFYRNLLGKYSDVCFRDSYSVSLFDDLPNTRMAPDIIFGYKIPKVEKIPKTIGFSIIDLFYRPDLKMYLQVYEDYCLGLILKYIELGYTINLFSFCTYEGDTRAIERISQKLSLPYQKSVNKVFYEGNIDDFLRTYLSVEIMYTTRFHATILSLLGEQKIVPFIYSKKMLNVLDDIGYTGNYINIQDIAKNVDVSKVIPKKFFVDNSIVTKSQNHFVELDKIINSCNQRSQ
ncbi:polysaccharide pyruvyl transferase family protein [Kaistella sp. BT6-1-3]|uniref:Polysaccharide pyruvyl transferase family protein n=1 Tax=Kaistella yananensis TaxID=2989820 RepID=A0ABT3JJX9_9FLAO|nr:polysaccharide pyruvyl transferase family protein [Kaistella yananensis]MCW4450785.1 polysaccharide pyruvyl transferase family protein [Kaistella yananensis]